MATKKVTRAVVRTEGHDYGSGDTVDGFRKKRSLSLSAWKDWKDGERRNFVCLDKIFRGREGMSRGKKTMEAPFVLKVKDLATGNHRELVLGKILHETIESNFPDGSYVGVALSVTKHSVEGKNYSLYDVDEIDAD